MLGHSAEGRLEGSERRQVFPKWGTLGRCGSKRQKSSESRLEAAETALEQIDNLSGATQPPLLQTWQ
jgi:hypothetical protein